MDAHATLDVPLTPELRRLIAAAIASGRVASADEAVREGLRLLADAGASGVGAGAPDGIAPLAAALRESEERLRTLADHLPNGMVYQVAAGPDGSRRFLFVSAGVERLFGVPVEEAMRDASSLYGLFLEEHRPRLAEAEAKALASRSLFNIEAPVRRRDGEVRWVQLSSAPRTVSDGSTVWDGVVLDITERVRAEARVRDGERRLEIATQAAELGIWDWDVIGGAMIYSERAKAIYGFAPGEPVTFEKVRDATHPDDLPRTSALARRALDPLVRAREPYEYRIFRPSDGKMRWVLAHGEAVFVRENGAERAVRYIGTLQDVTERRRAEETLRGSERRLRLAIEAGRMAVWEYDVAANTVRGSPELNRLLGFPPEASPTLGELRSRYCPGEQARLQAAAQAALAAGERHFQVEYRVLLPDGSTRWLLLRAEISLGPDGAMSSVVGVLFDITERMRAEDRQRLLIHELNHRVKNTLASVQSIAAQTFRGDQAGEDARRLFEARLMALAKAHDVLTRENWEGAGLAEIAAEALEPYRGGRVDRIVIEGPNLRVPPRTALSLAMALHELCTNAAKYGALSVKEGRVRLAWATAEGADGRRLRLFWEERGGPPVTMPRRRGFGTRLIERGLALELGGEVRLSFAPEGLVCTIDAPL